MDWAYSIADMITTYKILVEKHERDHLKDLGVGERIILK
jgi:hypothetical protein